MLDKQFCSLGISEEEIIQYLVSVGYWGNSYLQKRNQFVLSPCAYRVSKKQQLQLDELGKNIYGALHSISHDIYSIVQNQPRNRMEQTLIGVATRGSKRLLTPQNTIDDSIPPVVKVDMVQDEFGNFHIVEIDAYNPRGLGFNALLDNKADLSNDDIRTFNTIDVLANQIAHFAPSKKIAWIVSEHERYYAPSFAILQDALSERGIHMTLLQEKDFSTGEEAVNAIHKYADGKVFMIPESLENISIRNVLLQAYGDQSLEFFFPPKAYLGSKLLLPFFCEKPGVNGFIPKSSLLSKQHSLDAIKVDSGLVLKAGQSSGMKGVLFSDLNAVDFEKRFSEERGKKRPSWMVQEHVSQKSMSLQIFENGQKIYKKYYLRLIAQVTTDGVIGLDITGRTDRMVHGAPDCVMLPAVLD